MVGNQVCTQCVMDTSDPGISFDDFGVCNHCREFELVTRKNWFPNAEGQRRLSSMIERIKSEGAGHEYDCILGLSGGIDSSYLALKVKEWGLRPLVVHVDAGWNSELAVANIEKIVKHCHYDLYTHVVDWEEMRDLHLAFLKAGIANQDVPQDHIFFASLYHFATKNKIRYILSGGNIATEAIFPSQWQGSAMDAINLRAIHRRFGQQKLKAYKTISFFQYYIWYPMVLKMRTVYPLNFMPYDKEQATAELVQTIAYKPYDRKHGESQFTKIFQNYYLPVRFGYDKRKPHLSSLIVSGQMTRTQALAELEKPLYQADELEIDIAFLCKKLKLTRAEFDDLLRAPIRSHLEFANWGYLYKSLKFVQRLVARLTGKTVRLYS